MSHGPSCRCSEALGLSEFSSQWLHGAVDKSSVTCMGGVNNDDAPSLFKPHSSRFDPPFVLSDEDGYLLVNVGFDSPVTLHQLYLSGVSSARFPSKVRIFANHPELTLGDVEDVISVQELDVVQDPCGQTAHPLKVPKLSNVSNIQLLISGRDAGRGAGNGGEDSEEAPLEVSYIGFKGVASGFKSGPVNTVYEARANIADHPKTFTENQTPWSL